MSPQNLYQEICILMRGIDNESDKNCKKCYLKRSNALRRRYQVKPRVKPLVRTVSVKTKKRKFHWKFNEINMEKCALLTKGDESMKKKNVNKFKMKVFQNNCPIPWFLNRKSRKIHPLTR